MSMIYNQLFVRVPVMDEIDSIWSLFDEEYCSNLEMNVKGGRVQMREKVIENENEQSEKANDFLSSLLVYLCDENNEDKEAEMIEVMIAEEAAVKKAASDEKECGKERAVQLKKELTNELTEKTEKKLRHPFDLLHRSLDMCAYSHYARVVPLDEMNEMKEFDVEAVSCEEENESAVEAEDAILRMFYGCDLEENVEEEDICDILSEIAEEAKREMNEMSEELTEALMEELETIDGIEVAQDASIESERAVDIFEEEEDALRCVCTIVEKKEVEDMNVSHLNEVHDRHKFEEEEEVDIEFDCYVRDTVNFASDPGGLRGANPSGSIDDVAKIEAFEQTLVHFCGTVWLGKALCGNGSYPPGLLNVAYSEWKSWFNDTVCVIETMDDSFDPGDVLTFDDPGGGAEADILLADSSYHGIWIDIYTFCVIGENYLYGEDALSPRQYNDDWYVLSWTHENGYEWVIDLAFDLTIILGTSCLADLANTSSHYQGRYGMYTSDTDIVYDVGSKQEASDMLYDICSPHDGEDHDDLYEDDEEYYEGLDRDHTLRGRALYEKPSDAVLHSFIAVCEQISSTDTAYYPDLQKWQMEEKLIEMIEQMQELMQTVDVVKEMDQYKTLKQEIENQGDIWSMGVKLYCILQEMNAQLRTSVNGIDEVSAPCKELWQNRSDECKEEKEAAKEDKALANVAKNDTQSAIFNGSNVATVEGSNVANNAANAVGFKVAIAQCEEEEEASYKDSNKKYADEEKVKKITNGVRENGDKIAKSQEYVLVFDPDSISDERVNIHSDDHRHMNDIYWREEEKEFEEECYLMPQPLVEDRSDEAHEDIDPDYDPKDDKLQGIKDAEEDEEEPESITKSGDTDNEKDVVHADDFEKEFNEAIEIDENVLRVARMDREATLPNVRKEYERETAQESTDQMIGDAFKTFNICGTEETQNDEDEKGDVDPQQFGKGFEEALQNVRDVAKVDQELLANASCNIYSDLCDEEPDAKQLSETLGAVKDGLADEAREEFVELYQVVQDDDSDSDYDEDDEEKSDTGSSDESEDEQTLRSQPDEEEIGEIDINTSESRKEFEVALTVVRDVVKLDRELLVNGICSCYNDLVDDELDVEQLSHMFDVVKREFTEEGRDHFKSDEDHKDIDSIDNKLCGHCDNAAHLLENENRDARHPYVKVNTIGEDQSSILESLIESKLDDVIIIAHDLNLCFASCDTYGVFGQELVDFGLQFGCIDLTGESAAQRTKSVVQVLSLTQQITHLRTQNSAKQRRREMTEEEREKAMVQQQTLNAKIGNMYNDLCEQDVQRSSEVSSESISHTQNDDYIEKGKASRDLVMDLGTFALRVRCINHGSKGDYDHYLINYIHVAPTNGANVRSSGHDAKVDTQVVMKGVRNTKVMLRDMNSMRLDELLHCVGLNTSRCELYELIQSALKEQKVDVTLTDPISAAVVPRIAYPQALSNTKYYLLRSKAIKSPSHLSVIEEIYDSAVDERDLAHERQCDMRLEQIEAGYQVLSTGQINIQKMHHELKLQDQQIHEQSQLQQELVDVKQKVVMDRVDAAPSDTNKHEEDIELKQSEIDDDDEYNLKDEEDLHIEFAMKNAKYGSNYSHHEEDAVFSMRAHTSSAYEVFGGKLNRLFEEMPRTYDAMSNNAHLIEVIGLIYDVGFMIDFAENNSSKEVIDLLHDVRSQHVDFFGTSERIEFSTENVNYFEHSMEITEVENATGLDSTQAWILYEVIVDSLATFVFLTLFVYNRMTEYVLCHEEEELLLKGVGMIKSDVIDHTTDDNEDGERHMIVGRIYATIITGTNHYEGSACVPRYEVGDISPLDLSTDVVESFDIASVNEKEAMRCMHAKPQFETDEMVTDDDEYPKEYEEQRIKDNTKEKEMEDLAGIRMIKTDAKHATVYEGLTNHMELTYYLCVVEHCQDMTEVGVNSLGIALLDKIAMDHYYDTIVLEKNEEETDLQFTTMAFISALVMIIVRLFEATDHEEEKYDGIERDESDEDLFADNLLCLSDHEGNLLWHDIGSTYTDCEYNYIYGYSYEHVPRHFVSEDIVDYVCHSSRTKQHRCADDEVFLFKYYHKIQCADTEFNCNEYNDTMEEDVLRLNREKLKDIEENFFEDLASVRSTHSLCDWVKNTSSDVTLCRVRCRHLGVILTYIELIPAFEIARCILISKRATCTMEFIRLIATFDEQLLEIASGTRHGFVRAEIDSIVSDLELKSKLLFE